MKLIKKTQAGFTAIEVLVVLLVGGIIIAGAAYGIDRLLSSSSLTDEIKNINQLMVNTKNLRSTSGYGAAATDLTTSLVAIKGIPAGMPVVSGVIKNSWGGDVSVLSTGSAFSITYASVPKDPCIKLATKLSNTAGFATTKINSTAAVSGEVTSAAAITGCSTESNTLLWTTAF